MVRAAVLVSGGGANLQAIIDSARFGEISGMELAAVISSDAGAHAIERAKNARIPTYVVERDIFPNGASFCNALLNKLRDLDAELVVTAGFTEKLNYPLLHFYKNRVVSVQPALFPAFCGEKGFDPIDAIRETHRLGVRCSGATAYFMTEEDNGWGPIICQQPVELRPEDGYAEIQERIMRMGEWVALPKALALYCSGEVSVENGRVRITSSDEGREKQG